MRQQRRRGGAVAHRFSGALRRFPNHLRSQIFRGIFEFHFFGDGDAVVAHHRPSELFLDQYAFGLGAQRYPDRVGQNGGAAHDALTRLGVKLKLFGWHSKPPPAMLQSQCQERPAAILGNPRFLTRGSRHGLRRWHPQWHELRLVVADALLFSASNDALAGQNASVRRDDVACCSSNQPL